MAVEAYFSAPSWHLNSAHLSRIFHPGTTLLSVGAWRPPSLAFRNNLGKVAATSKPSFPALHANGVPNACAIPIQDDYGL